MKTTKFMCLFLVALMIVCLPVGRVSAVADGLSGLKMPSSVTTGSTAVVEQESNVADDVAVEDEQLNEKVIFDDMNIKVTAKGLVFNNSYWGPEVKLLIENKSDADITVQSHDVSVNGYIVDSMMSSDVAAGKKKNDTLTLSSDDLELAGITTIADIEFRLHIFDEKTWDIICDSEMIRLETPAAEEYEYVFDDSGFLLYEGHNVKIVAKGVSEDASGMGPSLYVYMHNYGDQDVCIQARDVSVNGFMVDTIFSSDLPANKHIIDTVTFYGDDLESNEIDSIETCELSFHIFDADSWDTIIDTEPITMNFG